MSDLTVGGQNPIHVTVDTGTSIGVDVIGIPGPPGEPGPPGDGEATLGHVHQQTAPSDVWVITHELLFKPSVTVVDTAGTKFYGSVAYPNPTTVVVTFSAPFAGRAFLS